MPLKGSAKFTYTEIKPYIYIYIYIYIYDHIHILGCMVVHNYHEFLVFSVYNISCGSH